MTSLCLPALVAVPSVNSSALPSPPPSLFFRSFKRTKRSIKFATQVGSRALLLLHHGMTYCNTWYDIHVTCRYMIQTHAMPCIILCTISSCDLHGNLLSVRAFSWRFLAFLFAISQCSHVGQHAVMQHSAGESNMHASSCISIPDATRSGRHYCHQYQHHEQYSHACSHTPWCRFRESA